MSQKATIAVAIRWSTLPLWRREKIYQADPDLAHALDKMVAALLESAEGN